jgi:hypothetical protein
MLSIMSRASVKGLLDNNGVLLDNKTLSKWVGSTEDEIAPLLAELEEHRVFSKRADGAIFNRRMYRDSQLRIARSEAGRKGMAARYQKDNTPPNKLPNKPITDIEININFNKEKEGGAGGEGDSAITKYEPRHLLLAEYLRDKVSVNVPYHKFKGNFLESWARDFRLMEEKDRVPFEVIKETLEWSQEDEFWKVNILSGGTFRERFGKLEARTRGQRGLFNGRGSAPADHLGALKEKK